MGRQLKTLEHRRDELQARAEYERSQLSLHFEPLKKPLSWANKGVDAISFLKDTPILWTGAFALLAHYKPKLASKALAVGWGAMKLLKSAKNLI
jgi:YqjK-like protein